MYLRFAFAAIAALFPAMAGAQSAPDFSALEQRAAREVDSGNVPSLAVAVVQDGRIVYERAFGHADLAARRAATVHTAYALASASKPITATALMQLARRGKVDLAEPVQRYLAPLTLRAPDGSTFAAPRLQQLLDHTSGLGTYAHIHYAEAIASVPTFAQTLARFGVLMQPPGRIAEYSNLGYGVISHIIEQRSGLGFGEYLERNVFAPLEMTDAFVDTPGARDTDIALPYDAKNGALPPLRNDTPGAGNIHASAHDLARFALLHLDPAATRGTVLKPADVQRMQRKADPKALQHYYAHTYYGLGWYVRPDDGGQRVVWHEGGMPGASSIIKLLPERHIGVVVLANKTEVNAVTQAVADDALRALVPGYAPAPLDATANYTPYAAQPPFLGAWKGTVDIAGKSLPCSLSFGADGKANLAFAVSPQADALEKGEFGGIVYGDSFIGAVPLKLPIAETAASESPLLLVKLVRTGEVLQGSLVAYSSPARLDFLLPFAVRLEKVR